MADINVAIQQYQINVTMTAAVPAAIQQVVPLGTIDGTNVTFTLPSAPTNFILLIADRQPQVQGTSITPLDYYITGTTITMTVAPQVSLLAIFQ